MSTKTLTDKKAVLPVRALDMVIPPIGQKDRQVRWHVVQAYPRCTEHSSERLKCLLVN